MKAFAYLRVSGLGQVDGDGFARQETAIRALADSRGWEVVGVFREEGVSGTKDMGDRPALTGLMHSLYDAGVQVVLVERADRLAREYIVCELILQEFRRRFVQVVSADYGDDLTDDAVDPTKKLIRQLMMALAEWEKSTLVLKLRAARQRKKSSDGKCEGRKAFGEHPKRPEEAAVLERIRGLASSGRTPTEIAETLRLEGALTRSGRPWGRGAVWGIVKRLSLSFIEGVSPSGLLATDAR